MRNHQVWSKNWGEIVNDLKEVFDFPKGGNVPVLITGLQVD